MKAVLRLGPLWVAPLRKPIRGAVLGFADACGDAHLILTGDQCRRLGETMFQLSRVPVGEGPEMFEEDEDVLALEALLRHVVDA